MHIWNPTKKKDEISFQYADDFTNVCRFLFSHDMKLIHFDRL